MSSISLDGRAGDSGRGLDSDLAVVPNLLAPGTGLVEGSFSVDGTGGILGDGLGGIARGREQQALRSGVQPDSYQTEDCHWSMAQGLGTPALELTVGSSGAVSRLELGFGTREKMLTKACVPILTASASVGTFGPPTSEPPSIYVEHMPAAPPG